MKKPSLLLRTFGCQMNARDSEFAAGILFEQGFREAESINKADVILFNSCSVRKHAEDRLFSNIAELKNLKEKRPELIIGLIGCTAQNYKDKNFEKAPLVDFVCGPGDEPNLPAIIIKVLAGRCAVIATDNVNAPRPELFPEYRENPFKAYVSIGEGCDNFCSYCIVPYVRGRERYRDAADIVKEIRGLAARGFKEVTLLGQNVNSYKWSNSRGPGTGFVGLLEKINKVQGIERIRFMTSHPKDASSDLFKAMRDLEKVCEHLHLPVQSGSTRILKLMNRGYTKDKYLKLAESYKKILPKGAITTDIIVGFPSETGKDYEDTLALIKKIKFDGAFAFKYSPRPQAKSAKLKDDVLEGEKSARLKTLLDLHSDISLERNKLLVGDIIEVLVDGMNRRGSSTLVGRTRSNKIVVFEGSKNLIGKLVEVHIDIAAPYVLKGRMADEK